MSLGRVALPQWRIVDGGGAAKMQSHSLHLSVPGVIYTIRFVCGLAGACPADANIPRENRIKMMPKIWFLVKNQLFKICIFRIAAVQHYCFSSQRTSLFCW
jgi:hypothetical protein